MLEIFFISMLAVGQETTIPKQFQGSKIQRVLSDGTVQEFDDSYAIVPRKLKSLPVKQETVIAEVDNSALTSRQQAGIRFTLLGGVSPSGLHVENVTNVGTIVSLSDGFVGGGSMQWDIDESRKYHGQMTVLSNGTFVFGFGVEID